MSFKFTALALDHGPDDPLSKLVLMALCDRANEKAICWPARSDLMARCKVGASTLSRKLRSLEAAGWIMRKQRFNASTVFRVNVQRLYDLEAVALAEKRATPPDGFEAFPEEIAAQAIENKGDALCGHTDALCGHTDALSEPTNLSINQSKTGADAALATQGAKLRRAQRSARTPDAVAGVTDAQRAAVMDGKTFDLFMRCKLLGETRAAFLERLASGDVRKVA